jgi:hypothetical protein
MKIRPLGDRAPVVRIDEREKTTWGNHARPEISLYVVWCQERTKIFNKHGKFERNNGNPKQ